jgi:hypothetical protein
MLVVASENYFCIGLCVYMRGNRPKPSTLEFTLIKGIIKLNFFNYLFI